MLMIITQILSMKSTSKAVFLKKLPNEKEDSAPQPQLKSFHAAVKGRAMSENIIYQNSREYDEVISILEMY